MKIESLFTNNLSEMRETLHAALSKKVAEALEEKKEEIAKKLLLDKEKCAEESCKSNDHDIDEGAAERAVNGMWNQINAHEKAAKATKNPIKKNHYMQMASDLRAKLPSSDDNASDSNNAGSQENPK